MNLVLAHDYLIQMGGAERVVAAMHRQFPSAPIYTSAVNRKTLWEDFSDADIRTTWLQHFPFIENPIHFKKYFPLYPAAFRSLGTLHADCAWISSSTFAKYLRFAPDVRTVCYVHNPTRFLWQTDAYLDHEIRNPLLNQLVRAVLPTLRKKDREAAESMQILVANSRNVQERIKRCYGRESTIIHPPVETERFQLSNTREDFYLIVSRLIGYKNIDLAVRVFSQTGRKLIVIGDGPQRQQLQQLASDSVKILGRLSDREIQAHYGRCRAFIFPGDEDFGITPLEAMACGKPVIALQKGGALETIVDNETGIFFKEPHEAALQEALERFEKMTWDSVAIRRHAETFSTASFLEKTERLLRL